MKSFRLKADEQAATYLERIALVLVQKFTIDPDSAVDRIEDYWSHVESIGPRDMIFHETPEFWAKNIYYGPDSEWHVFDPVVGSGFPDE